MTRSLMPVILRIRKKQDLQDISLQDVRACGQIREALTTDEIGQSENSDDEWRCMVLSARWLL